MAIRRKDLMDKIGKEDAEDLKRYEEEIDRQLAEKYEGCGLAYIYLHKWPRPRLQRELIRRYIAAGWKKVEFHTDQRDGEWMTIG